MSKSPSVSLVIVSRKRIGSLRRTLSSLRFQSFENFEVIVVSDTKDNASYRDLPFAQNICHFHYDEPNISAARNIGIAAAAGEIIAFCDDDAVPDPFWLERLIEPFGIADVASSGGYVRARNGIEFQWTSLLCDLSGDDHPLDIDENSPFTIVPYRDERFAKLQGTNCAFRKDALLQIGGFNEDIKFFLDETDVCLRLAQSGYDSAFVPLAQVHHGFSESDQRSDARVPKTLFDLGASKALFLHNHADSKSKEKSLKVFENDQHARLIALMVDGRIEPRDVTRLMQSLRSGFSAKIDPNSPRHIEKSNRVFTRFGHSSPETYATIAGSTLSRRRIMEKMNKMLANNKPLLVMIFSITSLYHSRDYDSRGFWVQTGGLFGKSNRLDPVIKVGSLKDRIMIELRRIEHIFPSTELFVKKVARDFVLEKTKTGGS